jgi:hypothetical protein
MKVFSSYKKSTAGNVPIMQPLQIWWEKPLGRASTGPLPWLTPKTWFGDAKGASSSPNNSTCRLKL